MSLVRLTPLSAATLVLALAACAEERAPVALSVRYDAATSRLLVTVTPALGADETLHARVRTGPVGGLDCTNAVGSIDQIDDDVASAGNGSTYLGPAVAAADFESGYDADWLTLPEPTPAMIAAAAAKTKTIDLCLLRGGKVAKAVELDLRRALDQTGEDGKFDGGTGERVASTTAYGEICTKDMGEIPFFPRLGDGDYATFNCLDATPIPTNVTLSDGNVTHPETTVSACDEPEYIYSLCEASAVPGRVNGPRVTSASNEDGTHWVLLCRKAQASEGAYNDIAMIGHNPYTGKTCFFQNALYQQTDGLHVPHPADKVVSEASPQESASLWEGLHGGLGSGIQCASCHDSDPFIHTPWIDGALKANGDTVVPKMGLDEDFQLGFNKAPYTIVNQVEQGWTMPKTLASPEAAACTKCHRIGNGRWAEGWLDRLQNKDSSWTAIVSAEHRKFEHAYWMPPEVQSLDEATWPESEYGKALAFIRHCGQNKSAPECLWEELPKEQIVEVGALPEVTLTGRELALEAAQVVGAQVSDPADPRCTTPGGPGGAGGAGGEGASCATRRCAECHSVSKSGLRHWAELTRRAETTCRLGEDADALSQEDALKAVHCLRANPEDAESVFAADKVGVLATGTQYGLFRKLFRKAYGETAWLPQYLRLKARVSMPKGSHPALSQAEYAALKKWFDSDLANLDVVSDPPPPSTCEDFTDTAALGAHIGEMKFEGWTAVNEEAGLAMYGCKDSGAGAVMDCFDTAPAHPEWAAGVGTLREVTQLKFRTSFWTRSSADGRYVANGGGTGGGATITDLVRGVDIAVQASYDPGFFPDNSGFIFQGGGTGICGQRMLETATSISFSEPGCVRAAGINLYQHVARGVNGGDYFVINSQFTSDSGSGDQDPRAYFNADSTIKLSPMIFNGTTYEQLPSLVVDSPFEGDAVLSPSSRLVINRLAGPGGTSLGYVIRRVEATKTGTNYQVKTDKLLARACFSGAKANISYDERFFVTHHYENGVANIYLTDLLHGTRQQVTNMPAGLKALFPHFRSDGWLYFLVRGGAQEVVVASDAALTMALATPTPATP